MKTHLPRSRFPARDDLNSSSTMHLSVRDIRTWVAGRGRKEKNVLKNMTPFPRRGYFSHFFRFDELSLRLRFVRNFTFIRRGSFNETRNMDENLGSRALAPRTKRWINFSTVASIAKTGLETSVTEHWKIFNSSWLSCEFDIYKLFFESKWRIKR